MTVLDLVVTVSKLGVTVLDLVVTLVVDTVIDSFVTVLDLLVKESWNWHILCLNMLFVQLMTLQQWWAPCLLQSSCAMLWLLHPSMLQVGFLLPCLMHRPPAWAKFEQDAWLHWCRPPSVKQNIPEPFALIQLVHLLYVHRPGNDNWSMTYYWLTNTMEMPRLIGKVWTQQCRGVVGLPMMVLTLVD